MGNMEVPEWASKLFLVTTGEHWPEAKEVQLGEVGAAWTTFGQELGGVESDMAHGSASVLQGWQGQGADSFEHTMLQMMAAGPVRQLVEGSNQMSTFTSKSAQDVYYTKYMIIGQLIILAFMIAQMFYLMAFPPLAPKAAAMIPFLIALG